MKDYKLSEIKKICESRANEISACAKCQIGIKNCDKLFGEAFPSDWEINEKDGESNADV